MLERLIRKEAPENLGYGLVVTPDPNNRRALIRWRNGIEVWASYLPADFPTLAVDQTVALGSTGGQVFVIRLVESAIPNQITLLEV